MKNKPAKPAANLPPPNATGQAPITGAARKAQGQGAPAKPAVKPVVQPKPAAVNKPARKPATATATVKVTATATGGKTKRGRKTAVPPKPAPKKTKPAPTPRASWLRRNKKWLIIAGVVLAVLGTLAGFWMHSRNASVPMIPVGLDSSKTNAIIPSTPEKVEAPTTNRVAPAGTPGINNVEIKAKGNVLLQSPVTLYEMPSSMPSALKAARDMEKMVSGLPMAGIGISNCVLFRLKPEEIASSCPSFCSTGVIGPGDFGLVIAPPGWTYNIWRSLDETDLVIFNDGELARNVVPGYAQGPIAQGVSQVKFWLKPGCVKRCEVKVTFLRPMIH